MVYGKHQIIYITALMIGAVLSGMDGHASDVAMWVTSFGAGYMIRDVFW